MGNTRLQGPDPGPQQQCWRLPIVERALGPRNVPPHCGGCLTALAVPEVGFMKIFLVDQASN